MNAILDGGACVVSARELFITPPAEEAVGGGPEVLLRELIPSKDVPPEVPGGKNGLPDPPTSTG